MNIINPEHEFANFVDGGPLKVRGRVDNNPRARLAAKTNLCESDADFDNDWRFFARNSKSGQKRHSKERRDA